MSLRASNFEAKQPQFMDGFSLWGGAHANGIFKLGLLRHQRAPIRGSFLAMTGNLFSSALLRYLLLFLSLFSLFPLQARDLWVSDDQNSFLKINTTLEGMGLSSAPSSDPALSPEGSSWAFFGRLRIEPTYQINSEMKLEFAYDNRATDFSGASSGIASALPANTLGYYRIWQIGGNLAQSGQLTDYNELDRACFVYETKVLNLTIGRQAIGWGRGAIFSAVDIFAPFTPLQIDQEWRRGVDAVRADVKLTDTTSLDMVSAWGPDWDDSALGARLRGYLGSVDAEFLVAKRAADMMYGVTSSQAIGGAEAHGEFAVFQTPGDIPNSGIFGDPNLIPKGVLGVSNNFNIGNGLKVLLEYHYTGFGVTNMADLSGLLANPDYLNRIERGDTQILGRQALALQGTYTLDVSWSLALSVFQSLIDSSGVLAPTASWDVSESFSLEGVVYVGYGSTSQGGVPQSQFGAVPPTIILKVSLYD
jgi:hypothetical protein